MVVQSSQEKTKLVNLSVDTVREAEMARDNLHWENQYTAKLSSKLTLALAQEADLRQRIKGNNLTQPCS